MTARTLWPARRIHMPAFFAALVLAPFLGSIAFLWLVIPVFALIAGLPVYFIAGTPALMWSLGRGRRTGGDIAVLAAGVNLALFLPLWGIALLTGDQNLATLALIYAGCGALTAIVWGGMFGWLYSTFTTSRSERRYS